jgi:hypothetical protein
MVYCKDIPAGYPANKTVLSQNLTLRQHRRQTTFVFWQHWNMYSSDLKFNNSHLSFNVVSVLQVLTGGHFRTWWVMSTKVA